MNATVIKVAFANPPKEGKKLASIKADDGQLYGVWPDKFGLFRPGRSYRVEFSTRKWQGQDYHTITKCQPIDDDPAAKATPAPARGFDNEHDFVTHNLGCLIQARAIELREDALIFHAQMLRNVYRRTFT